MQVKTWKAEISMLVADSTETARQTFTVEGGSVSPDKLPELVARKVTFVMGVLGDKTRETKRIAELEKHLEDANKKLELMREADKAVKPAPMLDKESTPVRELPVEKAAPKRGRPRKAR